MQPISSFNSNLGTAILLVGGAGSGKTALAGRLFPKTYFNVSDLNFKSGKDYWERLGLTNVAGFDMPALDAGKPVPINLQYKRMFKQLDDASKNPDIDCLVIDSATFVEEMVKAEICGAKVPEAIRLDGFKHWGDLKLTWRSLIMQLRQTGKKLIMTAHEAKERDESDQVFKYKIAVDGSIAALFPALFSDVWRCEVSEVGVGASAKHVWNVRTLSNARQEHLKNTYSFPGVLTADDLVKQIQAK